MKSSADKLKKNKPAGKTRAPGLDGVRAVAVLLVIAFHEGIRYVPGGFLGVDVFFVLSGYLITDLLLARQEGKRLDLSGFWLQRARRLLPAVITMLATVTAVVTVVRPEQLPELRPALIAAAFYSSNWYQIFHELSYFDSFGPLPPLQHLWSLAVEEQFYLIWPFILGSLILRIKGRMTRAAVVWLGAAASALTLAFLYHPGDDPSRVYYGTDTHSAGLLIGAGLAIILPLEKLRTASHSFTRWLDMIGIVALAVLGWAVTYFSGTTSSLYPGGLVLAALAAVALIAAAAAPGRLGKLLGWSPLQWIGVRSYGIYLWHWPVIALTPSIGESGVSTYWLWAEQTIITLILAALSWRWIESPILRNGYRGTFLSIYHSLTGKDASALRSPVRIVTVMSLVATVSVACTAGYGVLHPQQTDETSGLKQQIAQGEEISVSTDPETEATPTSPSAAPEPERKTGADAGASPSAPTPLSQSESGTEIKTQPEATSEKRPDTPATEVAPASSARPGQPADTESPQKEKPLGTLVSAVGDSIMLAAAPQLQAALPGITIDAKVSRHMDKGIEVVRKLVNSGKLREVVLVGLGTNGYITEEEVAELMRLIGPERKVVLINTYEKRPWQDEVNRIIGNTAKTYPNAVLVNWYDTIKQHPKLLWRDKVHPRKPGAELYAKIVAEGVRKAYAIKKTGGKVPDKTEEKAEGKTGGKTEGEADGNTEREPESQSNNSPA